MRQTTLAITSAIISRAAPFLALIIAARLLSPEEFGAFAVVTVVINLLVALVSGGGDLWLNRFIWASSSTTPRQAVVRYRYLQISLSIGAALIAVSILTTFVIPNDTPWRPLIFWATSAALVVGLGETLFAILRSSGAVTTFFVLRDLLAPIFYLGLLATLRPDTAADAIRLLPLATILPLFAAAFVIQRAELMAGAYAIATRILGGQRLRRLLRYTSVLIAGNLLTRLAAALDVLILGLLLSAAEVGEYRVAGQIALGFVIVQHFVFLGLPWQLRHFGSAGEIAERAAAVKQRYRLLVVCSTAALLILLIATEPILSLFGERFEGVNTILRLLLTIRFINLLWGPQHQIMISNGYVMKDAVSYLYTTLAWLAGFAAAASMMPLMFAAVFGHGIGSFAGHLYRHRFLQCSGISAAIAAPLLAPSLAILYGAVMVAVFLLIPG